MSPFLLGFLPVSMGFSGFSSNFSRFSGVSLAVALVSLTFRWNGPMSIPSGANSELSGVNELNS